MNILIIGGGGREHALAWKIAQSPLVGKIYCAPGNAGIASVAQCVSVSADDIPALKRFALEHSIGLTVVGPEIPLTLGIVDVFEQEGLCIFGPGQSASRLEGSKVFAKRLMARAGIPTADFSVFTDPDEAVRFVKQKSTPSVIKADGLAAGKGVIICRNTDEAIEAIQRVMIKQEFGSAGNAVVIEEMLSGEEASFICVTDGTTLVPLPSSQDHKQAFDNDKGPNTGGMGAYSPAPVITRDLHENVMQSVMQPVLDALSSEGILFKGFLYAGLMIDEGVPQVLEFNVRLGDPETQPILYRLQTDIVEMMLLASGKRLHEAVLEYDPSPSVCVVMASDGYPGDYTKGYPISGLDTAERLSDTMVFHAGTAMKEGRVVTNGGRVFGVTAKGKSVQEAVDRAYTAVSHISFEGAHYRKDIARKALPR